MPQDNLFLNKNRVAIFAFYNKQAKVLDYVLSYLKYLKEVCSKIVFVADCELSDTELKKLEPYVCHVIAMRHGEYDFGSYKRGLNYAKDNGLLDDLDELVICNDSCYCLYPLTKSFEIMKPKGLDFWGMTGSYETKLHVQSFFLVFNQKVVLDPHFIEYFNQVKAQEDFWNVVVNYEIPLRDYFENLGYKSGFIFTSQVKDRMNPACFPIKSLKAGVPLIKRKIFFDEDYLYIASPLYLTNRFIKKNYPNTYHDIEQSFSDVGYDKVYKKAWGFQVALYKKAVSRFIYRKEISKHGLVKYRFLTIPFIIYRKRNYTK